MNSAWSQPVWMGAVSSSREREQQGRIMGPECPACGGEGSHSTAMHHLYKTLQGIEQINHIQRKKYDTLHEN
jgi:hypothetical protein